MNIRNVIRSKRMLLTKVLGSASIITVAAMFTVAPALAADSPFCASSGSGLCLSNHGNTSQGATVYWENYNFGNNQNIEHPQQGFPGCGGFVSSANACPFTPGSGLNAQFDNDQIQIIDWSSSDTCIQASPSNMSVHVGGCSGNGTLWVAVPYGSNGAHKFVNVYATNQEGLGLAVCLASPGSVGSVVGLDHIGNPCAVLEHRP